MTLRTATIALCIVNVVGLALVAFATFGSGSDPATKGLDVGAGLVVTALFLVTCAPALLLTWLRRAPRAALVLAVAFPAALTAAFVAALVAFA
jgi:hypothetical protein